MSGHPPRAKAPFIDRRAEAERRYDSAVRALQRLTAIIRGDQSSDREDNLRQFFSATYGVLEQVQTACNVATKRGLPGKAWYHAVQNRADISLLNKLRSTEQHWVSTSIDHRVTLNVSASATIVAPFSLTRALHEKRLLHHLAYDPRVYRLWKWMRKPQPQSAPPPGYAWHLNAKTHNNLALRSYQLTATEVADLQATTAVDLLARLLAAVRAVIDDTAKQGIW